MSTIPDDAPVRVSTPVGRGYLWRGQVYPGVTTVVGLAGAGNGAGLDAWKVRTTCEAVLSELPALLAVRDPDARLRLARKCAETALGAAAARGTRIHAALEAHLTGRPLPALEPGDTAAFEAMQSWCDEHVQAVLASEGMVVRSTYPCYAGTFDLLAIVDGEVCVLDFKTGMYHDAMKFAMQVSAYVNADTVFVNAVARPMPAVDRALIVQPDASGEVVARDLTGLVPVAFEAFEAVAEAAHALIGCHLALADPACQAVARDGRGG